MKNRISMVAFFGPDGSGKSTVADLIEIDLRASGKQVIRYHWRPRVLPSLKKDYKTLSFNDPASLSQRNYLISFICYIYFFLDFLASEFFLFKSSSKNDSIIIYERYYYDVLVHPQRYRLKRIAWLGSFLARILRKPNISYLLIGTPEIIYARKPELTVEEIRRQIDVICNVVPQYSESEILNIDDVSAKEIVEKIKKDIKKM